MKKIFFRLLSIMSLLLVTCTTLLADVKPSGFLLGKTAVISGGTGGIGKVISMALAKEGATVVFLTHNPDTAKQLIKEMGEKYGVKGGYTACDITDEKQVQDMIKYVVDTFGSLDIAINKAGVSPDATSYPLKPILETSTSEWDTFMNNSLKGYFFSTKYELLQMKKQGSGVIINTALEGLNDVQEKIGLYYTAKSGVEALTKTTALENKNSGVRLNVVYADGLIKDQVDVGKIIAWLCADAASTITGDSINANLTK